MMRFWRCAALAVATCLAIATDAQASDGGVDDAAADADDIPLACDGALCDTTNGATCDVGFVGSRPRDVFLVSVTIAAIALARRRRRWLGVGLWLAIPATAHAAPPGPVDVVVHDQPPPRRYVSIAWNPVPIVAIGKLSFDIIIAPLQHHALVLNPFYATTTTSPIILQDATGSPTMRLPQQTFQGFGGEIGYRYYSDHGGLRGFFAGPSFIIGSFNAIAQDGSKTPYVSYGGALDVGYQMLVADRLVLALGVGAQYTATDKTIPPQQFPANVYANNGLRPRLLFSIGCAF